MQLAGILTAHKLWDTGNCKGIWRNWVLRSSHLQRNLGWKLVCFLTVMASSPDDRNPEHSSCLYTHCPGFVVSRFERSYFSAHMGGTITCHDYSSVNFLILSIQFPPSLFSSSLPLWRWLPLFFTSHSLWSLLPQGLPGALRVCRWLHTRFTPPSARSSSPP